MRRDVVLLVLIAVAAFGVRTYPAWQGVFGPGGVSFLETDAWYHVRLTENQVRNYPWRVTLDPYAAPGGQFVPIAPLFDTLISTAVVLVHGRHVETAQVELIAAFAPPVLGTLTVIAVWALARRLFDRRAALIAAALLAVLPGHFLDRTMLGFVDHHALEALLAIVTLLAVTRAVMHPSTLASVVSGVALGLYLLAWGSGAFLVAILGVWLLVWFPLARTAEEVAATTSSILVAAMVALVLVGVFQDSRMHRYESQIIGLTGLLGVALAGRLIGGQVTRSRRRTLVGVAVIAMVGVAAAIVFARGLLSQVVIDLARLTPDPSRMGVLEARPLFLYSGEWRWAQPWIFFRSGFFVGAIALVPFGVRVWRCRRAPDLLLLVFAIATFAATVGQNRFGYYLVTACAVLGGWLATSLLDWGGVAHAGNPAPTPHTRLPLAREVALIAVAGGMFAPNVSPRVLLAERANSFPDYWRDAMTWLGKQTPAPFGHAAGSDDDYYFARYSRNAVPLPDYTVMNWWDQGYWLAQRARRVAVSNPTQERAPISARFYADTDEAHALVLLRAERTRYVLADWELPFRKMADGTIMGRFQNVIDWAAGEHARFYEIVYRRSNGGWAPVWIFHEPYYQSMVFRLSVLGGAAAIPAHATSVITLVDRLDATGARFRELVTEQTFETYEAARRAVEGTATQSLIVGLDPWQAAFPMDALRSMVEVHSARTPEQQPTETPWVRIFEVQ